MGGEDEPLWLPIPERLDRKLRLGPFRSGREALKFFVYAAGGTVVAPLVSILLGVPVVLFGLAVTLWRPGGDALDERAVTVLAWGLRRLHRVSAVTRSVSRSRTRAAWVSLGPTGIAAVVRTGGVPLAYLPSRELRRRFEVYRDLLRGSGGRIAFLITSVPILAERLRPAPHLRGGAEGVARRGYEELVELIARHRSVREVYLSLGTDNASAAERARLEQESDMLEDGLATLGLSPTRLRDHALVEGAHRLSLDTTGVGG